MRIIQKEVFVLETRIFHPNEADIEESAAIIRRGGLLGIPTETVYGLGADALNEDAVRHIFEAKGRPQDNPLIIHIPSADWLGRYCENISPVAYELAAHFWPGPLTMILPRKKIVPLRTTGGLETVGVRCPDHPATLAIIEAAGVPIAAPSGNLSGRPSPTSAETMLEDMNGRIDGLMDGGACGVGVESTIIDLTAEPPCLLRPGGLPLEALEELLGEVHVDKAVRSQMKAGEKPRAPGMAYRHYAPKAPVTVVTGEPRRGAAYVASQVQPGDGVICFSEFASLFDGCVVQDLGASDDLLTQARRVFSALRSFDTTAVPAIWAQCPNETGLGLAVANRLKKAAGFHVVNADREGKLVLGLTGPTGAGKTSALRALEKLGALILDCDAVYHEMLKSDIALQQSITGKFGDVFQDDGRLDRQKLGNIVFADPTALEALNQIVYTHLPRALLAKIAADDAQVIGIDAINLVESGIGKMCQRTVAVLADPEVRAQRIMRRDGISREYALLRIRAQKDDDFYRKNCTDVLMNNAETPEAFEAEAYKYFAEIIEIYKEEAK